jgi:hypothetical protein
MYSATARRACFLVGNAVGEPARFQRTGKRFGERIIPTLNDPTHRALNIEILQIGGVFAAGVLNPYRCGSATEKSRSTRSGAAVARRSCRVFFQCLCK